MSTTTTKARKTTRRKRGSLSQTVIIEAAYNIARRQDLASISAQKIADELKCSAMAIYRHFDSVSEIVDQVVDRFVAVADVTSHDVDAAADPQAWLVQTYLNMYHALTDVPGVISVLGTLDGFGQGMLGVLDECLGVFTQMGCSHEMAVERFYTLAAFTLGAAGIHATSRRFYDQLQSQSGQEKLRLSTLKFASQSAETYPNIVAAAPALAGTLWQPDVETQLRNLVAQQFSQTA